MDSKYKPHSSALNLIRHVTRRILDWGSGTKADNPPTEVAPAFSSNLPGNPPELLRNNELAAIKNGAERPGVLPICVPSSSALEILGHELAELEATAALHKLFEFRSVIAGLHICLVRTQYNEITEEAQQAYDDIALEITGLAYGINRFLIGLSALIITSGPGLTSQHHAIRSIRQAVIKIKLCREQLQPEETLALLLDQEMSHYLRIVECLNQLQTMLQFETLSSLGSSSMVRRAAGLVKIWGTPVYQAHYKTALQMDDNLRGYMASNHLGALNTLHDWRQTIDGPNIFRMTAINTTAAAICEQFNSQKCLGASFFCSSTTEVCQILPTIAYQLALSSEKYLEQLYALRPELIENNRDIATQFNQLFRIPLQATNKRANNVILTSTVIVINALDACPDATGVKTIHNLLHRYANTLTVKFVIAGQNYISPMLVSLHGSHFINTKLEMEHEILLYLTKALSQASSIDLIQQLSALTGGQFIFAATAIDFLLPKHEVVDTQQRFLMMLAIMANPSNRYSTALDKLYGIILSNAFDDKAPEEARFRRLVLWTIVCARTCLTTIGLTEFLGVESQDSVIFAILSLLPVLHLSSTTGRVSPKPSFREFLLDSKRSGKYHCNEKEHSKFLAMRCFIVMQKSLRFNICGLETSSQIDESVPKLYSRVAKAVPLVLFHACIHWPDYLEKAELPSDLLEHLGDFLQLRLLFWMEVLNLKKTIKEGPVMLCRTLHRLLRAEGASEICRFLEDAYKFVETYSKSAACNSTPHIYISALPFLSKESRVYKSYWPQVQGLFAIQGEASQPNRITMMALSPDGARAAVGLSQDTIHIWDTCADSLLPGPILISVGSPIVYLAFSSDGNRIVSGTFDGEIHIWDTHTSSKLASMATPKHARSQYGISSVAFSHAGGRILSCLKDGTIQTYDSHAGILLTDEKIFTGRIGTFSRFSTSGSHLFVDRGNPEGVHLHDLSNLSAGSRVVGIANSAFAVTPDGCRVASGTKAGDIIIWDTHSDSKLVGSFKGHGGSVLCIAFSADSARMVSCGSDRTIRLWDIREGTKLPPPLRWGWDALGFGGHSDIRSVAFSSGGDRIISVSIDGTIRCWDLQGPTFNTARCQRGSQIPTLVSGTWRRRKSSQWLENAESSLILCLPEYFLSDLLINDLSCSRIIGYNGLILEGPRDIMVGNRWNECYIGLTGLQVDDI